MVGNSIQKLVRLAWASARCRNVVALVTAYVDPLAGLPVVDEAVALADHGQQQVFAIHFLMGITASDPLRLLQRLL